MTGARLYISRIPEPNGSHQMGWGRGKLFHWILFYYSIVSFMKKTKNPILNKSYRFIKISNGDREKPWTQPINISLTTCKLIWCIPTLVDFLNVFGIRFSWPCSVGLVPTTGSMRPGRVVSWTGLSMLAISPQKCSSFLKQNEMLGIIKMNFPPHIDGSGWSPPRARLELVIPFERESAPLHSIKQLFRLSCPIQQLTIIKRARWGVIAPYLTKRLQPVSFLLLLEDELLEDDHCTHYITHLNFTALHQLTL